MNKRSTTSRTARPKAARTAARARAPRPRTAAAPPAARRGLPGAGVQRDRRRAIVENVQPSVDAGRFPIKRSAGQPVTVTADIFTDGHDKLAAVLRYRHAGEAAWQEIAMQPEVNDVWSAEFVAASLGRYEFTVSAWIDSFASWRDALTKKVAAGQDVSSELLEGAELVRQAAQRATGADAAWLNEQARLLAHTRGRTRVRRVDAALAATLADAMRRHPDRSRATNAPGVYGVTVDPPYATFGAWYEMFPRSAAAAPDAHGTFEDVEKRLPYIAEMGFDVLYLPPIHPVGRTHRKGPNNTPGAGPGDPGSPWGIGAEEGGHTAIHPELGSAGDFRHLVGAARRLGIEVALDIAFQCSPDHPWVKEHPEWFRHRPDGTIQYAENPPKKYQDIYPLNFDSPRWTELWDELKRVFLHWIEQGVRLFRVDNPHTKAFPFWEWVIREVREEHPEAIFLSEAFTRPKVMRYLAKCGFSQSYTYFTWRNAKRELEEYLTELTQTDVREYLRPNFFTNTPDILHEFLQTGGRPAFQIRLILAATSVGSYGIYGPGFELCDARAVPGTEEYHDSEKYQIRHWQLDQPHSLRDLIARVNQIRKRHPALRHDRRLQIVPVDNDQILCFAKSTPDLSDVVVVVVNLDPHHTQTGWVELPLEALGIPGDRPYQMHDLIGEGRYLWLGARNYVALDPQVMPAHVFRVRHRERTERDFDYYE